MADDIVKQLRRQAMWTERTDGRGTLTGAADEITRLRALCREAQLFIEHDKNCGAVMGRLNNCDCGYDELWRKLDV